MKSVGQHAPRFSTLILLPSWSPVRPCPFDSRIQTSKITVRLRCLSRAQNADVYPVKAPNLPPVKYQILNCQGKDILVSSLCLSYPFFLGLIVALNQVGRLKIETPTVCHPHNRASRLFTYNSNPAGNRPCFHSAQIRHRRYQSYHHVPCRFS